jgi:segregation and condensation protein A
MLRIALQAGENKMVEVKTDQFKGPLDLLLDLIKKEKLDITQISLVKVTDQYLEYLESLKEVAAEEVVDFLLVAAKLLVIKSRVLLPKIEDLEDESDLVNQLRIYKAYLEASKKVNKTISKQNFLFIRQVAVKTEVVFSPPKSLSKKVLKETFNNFLERISKDVASNERERIIRKISIQERIREIYKILKTKKSFVLNSFFTPFTGKEERVVSFLAVLEMIKKKEVNVSQEKLFDDIIVNRI